MEKRNITLKNGLNIHITFSGDPSNPPLLLLHGWPSSSLLWRDIIPGLCDDFYAMAPDMPGYGHSDKPSGIAYDLAFLRRFVLDLMDALKLDTVALAAHDLGGMAALSVAARHPDRIEKLVIMNTCPYPDVSIRLKFSLFVFKQPWLAGFLLHPSVFKQVLKTGIHNHHLLTPDLIDCFRAQWVADDKGRLAFSNTIQSPLDQMVERVDKLKKIKNPTLILWGKKDIFFPFSIARRLHQDLENSQLIGVENAAHFCQEEEPGFIARKMKAFLLGDL